jgi:hypothetical protein
MDTFAVPVTVGARWLEMAWSDPMNEAERHRQQAE